ncbi:MAG: flagellin, partial [Oscillospiraceae bacterium]
FDFSKMKAIKEGSTFTVTSKKDGVDVTKTFEFTSGTAATGNVKATWAAGNTVAQNVSALATAITGEATNLGLATSASNTTTLTLTHDATTTHTLASATLTGSGLNLQIGDTAAQQVAVSITNMSVESLGLSGVEVGTEAKASTSIDLIKAGINMVSGQRADLGAIQNRLEHTINNLTTTTENMTAAESRIRDTDMAKEMMAFTKNNVLAQAAQAMLAQANQQPQQVLQLLR